MKIFAPLNTEPLPILQRIEVATFFQLPSFHLVGLPGPEVSEAKERVRAAIDSSGLTFPRGRVVVNLSPSDIRKRGTGLDLGIALAVLALSISKGSDIGAWGELGLDGSIKPCGQLTRTLYAAWKGELEFLILCKSELGLATQALECLRRSGEMMGPPPVLVPVMTLKEAWSRLNDGNLELNFAPSSIPTLPLASSSRVEHLLPISASVERMLGMVLAGKHHFLILGPRGVGKSQLIEWLISLQPEMSSQDRLHQQLLLELAQNSNSPTGVAPARWVSPQVKPSALVGGYSAGIIRPGEFSLAQGGFLIADEFPEWGRDSRESLREPLERRTVTISRVSGSAELPADFQLIATGNLCPCGGWPSQLTRPSDPTRKGSEDVVPPKCRCTYSTSSSYLGKLSGPVLDRIDCVALWKGRSVGARSEEPITALERLRLQVDETQRRCEERWGKLPGLLSGSEIEAILNSSVPSESTLSWRKFWLEFPLLDRSLAPSLSLRARHKIARVGLTLSAWDAADHPTFAHWMEATCYRPEKFLLFDETA